MVDADRRESPIASGQTVFLAAALYLLGFGALWADVELAQSRTVQDLPEPVLRVLEQAYGWALDLEPHSYCCMPF